MKTIDLKTGFMVAAALFGTASVRTGAKADEFRRSIDLNVPHTFVAGSETLPSGRYTISSADTNGGEIEAGNPKYLLIRGNGESALIGVARRIDNPNRGRTQLVMRESPEGPGAPYYLDKLFISGIPNGYEFTR